MKKEETINTTNTLRGIAISAVLINHYLNLNVTGDITGFANLWISIFFICSGYGLFFSLDRRFAKTINRRDLFTFYYDRLIRIFPLLWIAWLIELIVRSGNLSFWIPSGIHASGHYWFIPALMQCYILAPLIYLTMKKWPIISTAIMIAVFFVINFLFLNNYAPNIILKIADFTHSKWRELYFLHILMFLFGYLISFFIYKKGIKIQKKDTFYSILFYAFIFSIVISMVVLKYYVHNRSAFALFPLFPIFLLCIYSLVFSIDNRFFDFLGRISYPIYLFHMSYYLLLSNLGEFPKNCLKELMLFFFMFPFFVILCYYLERLGGWVSRNLKFLPLLSNSRPSVAAGLHSPGAP